MNKNYKPVILASEIAVYLTCRKAWAYQKEGAENINFSQIRKGEQYHHQIGYRITYGKFGKIACIGAFVLSVAFLIGWVIS